MLIVFKGLSLKQIKQIFLEGETLNLKVSKDESLLIILKKVLIKKHSPCLNLTPCSTPPPKQGKVTYVSQSQ